VPGVTDYRGGAGRIAAWVGTTCWSTSGRTCRRSTGRCWSRSTEPTARARPASLRTWPGSRTGPSSWPPSTTSTTRARGATPGAAAVRRCGHAASTPRRYAVSSSTPGSPARARRTGGAGTTWPPTPRSRTRQRRCRSAACSWWRACSPSGPSSRPPGTWSCTSTRPTTCGCPAWPAGTAYPTTRSTRRNAATSTPADLPGRLPTARHRRHRGRQQ
jgi:hypothetical protein